MTTNQSDGCLTAESMERLARGELPAAQMVLIEEHIGSCEYCRFMLDSSSHDSQWQDEVLPVLQATSDDYQKFRDDKNDGQEEQPLESVLKLLGPTDDPHKLGRIGTYEVIGVIGRGGMGVVFKAFDAALNRFVAIKMLLPHLAASGAARKRFAREGQAAAAVIDDNVLPIYSVAEWQGVPYLVTQYSRGTTLQKRILDQGPLELKEILRIGMQTAKGLAAAHAQGLVHRDVKPSNILLDGTVERALLTDFGLARAVDDASITRTGIIAGTPQYMSPEQARGGSVDARSDLFGLGSVLYAMCTGRPPFRADNSYAVLRLITDAEPRPIQEINPDIPEWLCRLIARLMAKSPNDRFSTAAEVADALEQCLAHVQQPTVTALPEQLQIEMAAGLRRRSGLWKYAISVLLVAALGVFSFIISFQSADEALSLNISGIEISQLYQFPNAFQKTVPDSWFRRDPFKELSKSPENPVAHIRMSLELAAWEPAQQELELTMEQQTAIAALHIMSIPTDPFGTFSVTTEAAREKLSAILTREQQIRLDQLVWQRLAFEAFETSTMQSQLELAKEQKQGIRQAFVDHKQRTLLYDAALAELRQSGMASTADIALAANDREVLGLASLKQAWDAVFLLLTEKQRDKFESLRGPLVKYAQQSRHQDSVGQMSRESMLQNLAQEKERFPLYDSILAQSSVLAEKLRLAERLLYDDRQAFNAMNTALSNDFQQWQRDYRTLLRAKEIIPWLTQQPEHRALMLWAAEYHSTNRFSQTQNLTLEQLRVALPAKPSEEQLLQFLLDVSRTGLSDFETALEHSTITPTQEQQSHCHDAELLRTIQDIQSLYVDVAHHTSHVSVLQRSLDEAAAIPPTESQ